VEPARADERGSRIEEKAPPSTAGRSVHLPSAIARSAGAFGFRSASISAFLLAVAIPLACSHRGQTVPGAARAGQPGHFVTVASGETLASIGRREGVTAEAIARENGLDAPETLAVGRVLFVPAPRPVAAARAGSEAIVSSGEGVAARAASRARLLWPVRGVIYSPFGPRGSEHHDGLDLAAPEGTPIVAADAGTVLYAGEQRGYGRIVLIAHRGDLVTVYAHNRDNLVHRGETVARGQQLATVGQSGNASGPHVHFEVRQGTRPRNPMEYLR
jgi:lipoprotein NlpD